MRSAVVFLSVCGAFGSTTASTCESDTDSQALLQAKKVVRHQQSQNQKTNADDVLSSLQKVASTLTKDSTVTMTPEEVNAAIGQASTALATMFPLLTQQHELAEREIQDAIGAINACHQMHGNAARATREERVATSSAAIDACEQTLESAVEEEQDKCRNQGVNADCECTEARLVVTDTRAVCAAERERHEAVFCESQLFCGMLHECHAQEVSVYEALEMDLTAAMEARQEMYVALTQSDCILSLITTAISSGTPIDNAALTACGSPPQHLTLEFPQPPDAAEPCHVVADGEPQCEFEPHELVCGAGSPPGCQCRQVQLNGVYSAGPVIRCDGGIDVHHTTDQNSCPSGWKIFSPASQADWEVLHDALGDHNHHIANPANTAGFLPRPANSWPSDPWLIVDVSRSDTPGHIAQPRPAMNSANPAAAAYHTSDGSPFWLREDSWGQPDGNYHANCFLDIFGVDPANMHFDDHNCVPHSASYLCQQEDFFGQTADGCPRDNSNSANSNGGGSAEQDASDFSGELIPTAVYTHSAVMASVRCCSMDGTSCVTSELDGGCHSGKTLAEAEAICAANDMRLCTEHEMANNVCCNTGCWFNHHATWVTPSTLGSNPRVDTKCVFGGPHASDRLFRVPQTSRAACFALCQNTENCNHYSWGRSNTAGEGDLCMGCSTLDSAQHHDGFTAYDV